MVHSIRAERDGVARAFPYRDFLEAHALSEDAGLADLFRDRSDSRGRRRDAWSTQSGRNVTELRVPSHIVTSSRRTPSARTPALRISSATQSATFSALAFLRSKGGTVFRSRLWRRSASDFTSASA